MKIFFKNFLDMLILVWFVVKNQTIELFTIFLILILIFGGIIYFQFYESNQKFIVFLTGEFSPSKKIFFAVKGIVVLEIPENNCFLLDYGDKVTGSIFSWENAVFVTVSFNGVTKKISADKCWMLIPRDGELILEIGYNPKYFNPNQVRIFTGIKDNSPTGFTGGDFTVEIHQYESGEEIGKMPEVEDIPKPQPPTTHASEPKKTEAGNGGKNFFLGISLPDLSGDEKKGFFDEPFPVEKQEKIKENFKKSWEEGERLLREIISSEKGEEEKK